MSEKIRLQKLISMRGFCSRRKAEELISSSKVKVNGELIIKKGYLVEEDAKIEIEGFENNVETDKVTFLFNKPLGVVSSVKDDRGRKTVIDFFKNENYRLYPVGRLDYNTSGVLLVSNDGELTNLVTHPSTHLNKCYLATVEGKVKEKDLQALRNGVLLEDGMTQKAIVEVFKEKPYETLIFITIHEGRNRQVRRMFEHFSYHIKNLNRESIAFLNVKGLKRGEYRKLTQNEVDKIKLICRENKKSNVIPTYKKK